MIEHVRDMVTKRQAMRLASGSALVGRMAKAVFDSGTPLWRSTAVTSLIQEKRPRDRGHGHARRTAGPDFWRARGVVLATGGYPHDMARRKALAPIPRLAEQAFPMAKEGCTGDGIRMAEEVGGKIEDRMFNTTSWWPVSRVPNRRGGHDLYAHGVDRSKPGFIIVNGQGKRFERETAIGNDLVRAMAKAAGNAPIEAWLIADQQAVSRFGIGVVRPSPLPHGHHVRSGYVIKADTLDELARKCGIDQAGFAAQVATFNANANQGVDPEFHRGESPLDKRNGDPLNKPNPSLRALEHGPFFFAVKILPGDFSTLAGLRTNGNAQVLGADGGPIPGLYAAGNDLNTMGGGNSPAGGFTLGPAVTFGFIAGQHMGGAIPDAAAD
ncbi:FAD-binding protein [Novosphingobium colocasiae]